MTSRRCLSHDFDWAGVADPGATTAVYMPKATIRALCAELLARGRAANHPATAVFDATRATETVVTATLATLPNRLELTEKNAPCIVLVGEGLARCGLAFGASSQKQPTECCD